MRIPRFGLSDVTTFGKSIVVICIVALIGLSVVTAQSGRKPPKPSKSSTTLPDTPPSTSSPSTSGGTGNSTTPDTTSKPVPAKTSILIADDGYGKTERYGKVMLDQFVDRLKQSEDISPSYIGVLKKNAAIERAKSEKTGWLVFVEIRIDHFNNNSTMDPYPNSAPDMTFNYTLYQAATGLQISKGKARYQGNQTYGRGPIGLPTPIPQGGNGRYTPEETGRSAADQVLIDIQGNARGRKSEY